MGKLAKKSSSIAKTKHRDRFRSLASERKRLTAQLAEVDQKLANLNPSAERDTANSPAELDRWFTHLTAGLDKLPPLPADFSRADLYDDHD